VADFLISGASGWMGREAIAALLDAGHSAEKIRPLSSSKPTLRIHGADLKNYRGNSNLFDESWGVYLHTAFLTREFYNDVGPDRYREINLGIISSTSREIRMGRPKSVVLISSGSTRRLPGGSKSDPSFREYAELKRIETSELTQAAVDVGANVVEGVLYSATGRYMKNPISFAIGNLLNQAKEGHVVIDANSQVWRRYCDAGQYLQVLMQSALQGESVQIDSGGELVELGELGEMCLDLFNKAQGIPRKIDLKSLPDFYFSTSTSFEARLVPLGLRPLSIREQLENVRFAISKRRG
jgi:nucleoside-diphosphate-sugar epimerase